MQSIGVSDVMRHAALTTVPGMPKDRAVDATPSTSARRSGRSVATPEPDRTLHPLSTSPVPRYPGELITPPPVDGADGYRSHRTENSAGQHPDSPQRGPAPRFAHFVGRSTVLRRPDVIGGCDLLSGLFRPSIANGSALSRSGARRGSSTLCLRLRAAGCGGARPTGDWREIRGPNAKSAAPAPGLALQRSQHGRSRVRAEVLQGNPQYRRDRDWRDFSKRLAKQQVAPFSYFGSSRSAQIPERRPLVRSRDGLQHPRWRQCVRFSNCGNSRYERRSWLL